MLLGLIASIAGAGSGPHVPPAYLDPATGSLIVQAVIGTILGVSFFLRTKIAAMIDRIRQIVRPGSGD